MRFDFPGSETGPAGYRGRVLDITDPTRPKRVATLADSPTRDHIDEVGRLLAAAPLLLESLHQVCALYPDDVNQIQSLTTREAIASARQALARAVP